MDLDMAAAELYALVPEEFVAHRTALVKQARADGDRDLAKQIQALARPTRSAWLLNLVARHQPEVLADLFELAELLAEGMRSASGPELQQLTRQRNTVVASLTRTALGLGHEQGHRASDGVRHEVSDTLTAALADPVTADLVRSGTLSRAVQWSGFGLPGVDARPARSPAPAAQPNLPTSPSSDGSGADIVELAPRRRAAEQERLRVEVERRRTRLESARTRRGRLAEQLTELSGRIEQAVVRTRSREEQSQRAQQQARAAEHRVRECEQALEAARADHAEVVRTAEKTAQELADSVAELRRERERDATVREQMTDADESVLAAEQDVASAESALDQK